MPFQKGNKINSGRIFSEKHIKNMSLAKTGEKNPMFGKHPSTETRKKIGMAALGRKHTEEWKKKIKDTLMNHKVSEETKDKIRLKKLGFKHSEETRKKISKLHRKEKSYLWKGGITPLNSQIRNGIEFRLWRESVFARDNWTCQRCKIRGGVLHSHHVKNFAQFPELRFAIDNGITLCKKCHREFHKKYGTKNNTREQLAEFLNNL